jgi:hypothetical protein
MRSDGELRLKCFAIRTCDVGGTDVATTDGANIFLAEKTHEEIAERYRAKEVSDREDDDREGHRYGFEFISGWLGNCF